MVGQVRKSCRYCIHLKVNQSHHREVPRWEIFMVQELIFWLDLGRMANLPAFIASKSFDLWKHHISQMKWHNLWHIWCIKNMMILKPTGLLYNDFEVNLRLSYVIDTSHPLIDLPNTKSYQERHLFFVRLVKLDLYYIYLYIFLDLFFVHSLLIWGTFLIMGRKK